MKPSCYQASSLWDACAYHFDGCCQHLDGNTDCDGNGIIDEQAKQDACSHDYAHRAGKDICWKCGYTK